MGQIFLYIKNYLIYMMWNNYPKLGQSNLTFLHQKFTYKSATSIFSLSLTLLHFHLKNMIFSYFFLLFPYNSLFSFKNKTNQQYSTKKDAVCIKKTKQNCLFSSQNSNICSFLFSLFLLTKEQKKQNKIVHFNLHQHKKQNKNACKL